MRSPVTSEPATGCALLKGDAACRCADDAQNLSDRQIMSRASDKLIWYQHAAPEEQGAARIGIDALIEFSRGRDPTTLCEVLRIGIMLRVLTADPTDSDEVDVLLGEFSHLSDLSADPRRLGEAAALRAYRTAAFGHGENALPDTAVAVALLSDIAEPEPGEDPVEWARLLARTLNNLVLVLLKLGSHELADEMSKRAIAVADTGSNPMERVIHQLNRVRLQLSWALRLERAGRDAAAATRFFGAAQTAHAAAALWGAALGRAGDEGRPAAEECPIIGAAYALQRPGAEHLPMLYRLQDTERFTADRIVIAIAIARCELSVDRPDVAIAALVPLRDALRNNNSEVVLALALHREFAKADNIARGALGRSDALSVYAEALEDELWALREARLTALRSHSEHHRLTREHGAVAAQALQDPLTTLPNRRALDQRLAEVTSSPTCQPCTVALIDLDGFKDVNDARSHAAGDTVLREIAECLRTTLRSQDLVARYGGDEFVVVMPSTSLRTARAALTRATQAVAALPADRAAGVTMSVGVVRAPLGGDPSVALAAADAAMYAAKREGGNTVVSGTPPGPAESAPGPKHRFVPAAQ